MARKARDYKAEERRRNELARERGFTSRAQERNQRLRNREQEAREWGIIHAYSPALKYDYKRNNPHHLSRPAYLRAYNRLIDSKMRYRPDGRPELMRSPAVENWLVDVTDTMTQEDYDGRYPPR